MEHVSGGYFLVRGAARAEHMSPALPPQLWTVSTCICDTVPDTWALPWSKDAPDTLASARELLGLQPAEFDGLRAHVEELRTGGGFGWPNVFLDLSAARVFWRRYCSRLKGMRLLGIGLPGPRVEAFLTEAAPSTGQDAPGVFIAVSMARALAPGGTPRGFEVLGYEWGSFHSFICNGLEREYARLGLALNNAGLFDRLSDAERAAEFTNRDSTGAEPVPWDAWKIEEYDVVEAAS